MGPHSHHSLKERNCQYQHHKALVNFKQVNEVANEQRAEYVREGKHRVKQLELFFANVQSLLNGFGEGLGVVEGVVITETGKGDEGECDHVDPGFGEGELVWQVEGSIVRHI